MTRIFDKMLSEWLIDDPIELANSTDLDWQTVWDTGLVCGGRGRGGARRANTPSTGLPMREPGARLVPGAADGSDDGRNGRHRTAPNGGPDAERA